MKRTTSYSLLSLFTLLGLGCSDQQGMADERVGEASQRLTQCVTFQRGVNGTVADTVISSNALTKNEGAQTTLGTSDKQEVLLWVDVASIPSHAVVNSATLKLYINATGNGVATGISNGNGNGYGLDNNNNTATLPINLHRATAAWVESAVTYASFAQHFDPVTTGVIQPSADSTLKQVDLKSLVQSWVNGSQQNHGVLLETADKKRTIFVSSESAAATLRPALEVCYAVPDEHCQPNPCQNAGTCINGWEGYTCECAPGYTGTNCEINIDDCAPGLCQNGGTCTDLLNGYTCTCADGFTGANCEINIDECASAPCQNGGVCIDGVNAYSCTCPPGFTGTSCEIDINECAANPCVNGECTDLVNSYACTCTAGFTGTNCETNIDDCVGNACQNSASCIDGVASYACACVPGFSGTYCETNIDDCAGAPCLHDGTCADGVNGYTCACAPGYTGTNCEVDINDCAADPCQHDGLCVDGVNSYTCTCPAGWTGPNCDVDVDECAAGDPCHVSIPDMSGLPPGTACVNTPGSFTCECVPLYAGTTCEVACPCYMGAVMANDMPTGMPWLYGGLGIVPTTEVSVDASGVTQLMLGPSAYISLSATSCTGDFDNTAASSPAGLTHYPLTPAEYAACQHAIDYASGLVGLTSCAGNPCQNGGTCTTTAPDSYTCSCPVGIVGTNCETVCPVGYGGADCSTALTYCALVKSQNPAVTDGIYTFDVAGHQVDLYCHDMNFDPREYLPLAKTGAGFNFSTYAPDQTTTYTKVRFFPDTLTVDITDATFSTTVGTNVHGTPNVAYATAADCIDYGSAAGTANVDLTGTPFALAPGQLTTQGWYPAGSVAYGPLNKTADLTGGGYCGMTSTADNGATPLQLVFQADAPSCAPGNQLLQGACMNWFGNNIDVAAIEASGLWDVHGIGPWGAPLPGVNCTDATTSDLGFNKSCGLDVAGVGAYVCESDCIDNQCCALPRED